VQKTLRKPAAVIAPIVIAIMTSLAAAKTHAQQPYPVNANDDACFPMCQEAVAAEVVVIEAIEIAPPKVDACGTESPSLLKQAEQLNDRVKPIKEIVGYVRSPQGLAIKLVNDHVVKIPAWVGYAIDPVGSLKNRAMDEVRTRAKAAIGLNRAPTSCAAETAAPIDAALIPIDTQQI
jgi:hypothetical protein